MGIISKENMSYGKCSEAVALKIKEMQLRRGKPILLFFTNVSSSIGRDDFEKVVRVTSKEKEKKDLDLVIYSVGGSLDSAFSINRYLRRKFGKLSLIVPSYAKSAATIFAFGADEIIMGKKGEFGPLDAQVRNPNEEGRMSTLDTPSALESIQRYSLQTMDTTVKLLLDRGVSMDNAIRVGVDLSARMAEPLLRQLDPLLVGQHYRITRTAEDYGIRLATSRGCNIQKEMAIIKRLVGKYPSHEFVIDLEEAIELGINATEMNDDDEDVFATVISALERNREPDGSHLDCIEYFPFEQTPPIIMPKQEISISEKSVKR